MSSSESAPAAKEHAADEAAGDEVVFTSDGADDGALLDGGPSSSTYKVVTVRPPPVREASWLGDDSVEDEDFVDASGCAVGAGDLLEPDEALRRYLAAEAARRAASAAYRETPAQRLDRLRGELDDVARDVEDQQELKDRVADLKERLEQKQQVLHDKVLSGGYTPRASAAAVSVSPSAATSPANFSSDLDALLVRLEKAVGSIGAPANNNKKALLERVSALEHSMEMLDPSKLEAVSRKAKVIRQDLEAASKARNKMLSSGGGGSSHSRAEDAKTIAALYDSMVELQGISSHLPALTLRLRALAAQHVDAATWAGRLRTAEGAVTRLNAMLGSCESAVERIEKGWEEQSTQLRENLAALDQRIGQLQQATKESE